MVLPAECFLEIVHSQKRWLNPPFIITSDRFAYICILLSWTKSLEWHDHLDKPIGAHHYILITGKDRQMWSSFPFQ